MSFRYGGSLHGPPRYCCRVPSDVCIVVVHRLEKVSGAQIGLRWLMIESGEAFGGGW